MRPASARLYPAYGALSDAIVFRDYSLETPVFADFIHLLKCQLGCSTTLTTISRAVAHLVGVVARRGIPAKVGQAIVLAIAVVMAAFHFVWPRAHKGRQNQGVNPKHFGLIPLPQKNEGARVCLEDSWLLISMGFYVPYPAKVGNLVYSLVFVHRLPVFHTQHWHNSTAAVNGPAS